MDLCRNVLRFGRDVPQGHVGIDISRVLAGRFGHGARQRSKRHIEQRFGGCRHAVSHALLQNGVAQRFGGARGGCLGIVLRKRRNWRGQRDEYGGENMVRISGSWFG